MGSFSRHPASPSLQSFRNKFLLVRRHAVGDDQGQAVLMCVRYLDSSMSLRLTCSALLRPLLCKTRFSAYSARLFALENSRNLRRSSIFRRCWSHGLSCTKTSTLCTTLHTKVAASSRIACNFAFLCFPIQFGKQK